MAARDEPCYEPVLRNRFRDNAKDYQPFRFPSKQTGYGFRVQRCKGDGISWYAMLPCRNSRARTARVSRTPSGIRWGNGSVGRHLQIKQLQRGPDSQQRALRENQETRKRIPRINPGKANAVAIPLPGPKRIENSSIQ